MKSWLMLTGLLLVASPASAAWHVAESAHFRVYSEGSPKILADRAAMLEDYRALLEALTTKGPSTEALPRLDVFLVDRISQARPFGNAPEGAAGFYSADTGRIAAYAERNSELGQSVLLHEYAHHYLLGSANVAYPAWYVEGFAEYFMTAAFRPERIEVGKYNESRVTWLLRGTWLPLETILARSFDPRDPKDLAMFYAQSWLLTHYLFRADGMLPKLAAYLRAVAGGTDPVAAFKAHIDPDPGAFQYKLRTYLTSRKNTYSWFSRSPATPAAVTVTALPASADAMLLQLAALEFGVKRGNESAALASVRAAAARHPDDPLAARTHAFAELRYGDRAVAATMIDRLLTAAPADPLLLRWRAIASLPQRPPISDAARREARALLVKAFSADPDDWRTLFRYVLLAGPFVRKLSENDLDVLLRAHQLAPQVAEIGITTAVALAQADRLAEAAAVLEPIAHAAHGGALHVYAAKALDRAIAGDRAGFLAVFGGPAPEAD